MATYLLEAYLPRSRVEDARAAGDRARAAAEELSREGADIHYVRTTFLPEDETCFHVFEAGSEALVEEVSRRAALCHARIVPALEAPRRPGRR
jgi:hypothetical protein